MIRAPWLLVPLFALVSQVAEAAEAGDIRGKVVDQDGLPIPSANIVLSGPMISGEIHTTTDDDGRFSILQIPTGQHQLEVQMGGFKPNTVTVTVRLDESAFVPVTLASEGTTVEVTVTTTLPVLDATRSAVSTELTSAQLANLPVGRSYQDAVNMVAGVSGRIDTQEGGEGSGNPSVRGEGSYGNNYFIDGISTRDPATKTFGSNLPFDAIDSIQVYTDGAPAEFGQFTGMLVNVDTKDGGDEFHGTAADYVAFTASGGTYEILGAETDKSKEIGNEFAATLGGPFVKEKLWYFLTLDFIYDRVMGGGVDYPVQSFQPTGLAKLTWNPNPDLTFSYEGISDNSYLPNEDASALVAAEATSDQKELGSTHILTMRYHPGPKGDLEVKAATTGFNLNVVPHSGDEDTPQILDLDSGQYSGNSLQFDYNIRSRTGGSLKFTQLAEGFAGEHKFKVGTEGFYLRESRELIFTGAGEGQSFTAKPSLGYPCTTADHSDCYGYTLYNQTDPIAHTGITTGTFLQDDWHPVEPLTLNLGVRLDTEALYTTDGDHLITNWMPVPRLGAAWDVTNDSKTKISANYGWYYDLNGNDFASFADSRSSDYYSQYQINTDTGQYDNIYNQDPVANPSVFCTDDSLNKFYTSVDKDYADSLRPAINRICGNGLKPYHLEKLVVGVSREIVPLLAVTLRGIISRTENIPEDIDIDGSAFVIGNVEQKSRDYKAVELTLERKYDDVWSALVSWTLSSARGATPGQFELSTGGSSGSSGNDVGVYLDDVNDIKTRAHLYDTGQGGFLDGLAGLGTVFDDAGYYGYLPYHSFNDVKVNTFYKFPFGTTLGLVYELDSGHAWQKRGLVPLYADFYSFPEGRGSRFMPPTNYIDVRIAHALKFENDRSIELGVDIFNLPDLQAPTFYYENDNSSFGEVFYRQAPRAIQVGLKGTL